METVGSRIKKARKAKGLTQDDISRLLGIDRTHVSRWERDEFTPRDSTRLRLATALGVDPEWLRTGEGEMEPSLRSATPEHAQPALDEAQLEIIQTAFDEVHECALATGGELPIAKHGKIALMVAVYRSKGQTISREQIQDMIALARP